MEKVLEELKEVESEMVDMKEYIEQFDNMSFVEITTLSYSLDVLVNKLQFVISECGKVTCC